MELKRLVSMLKQIAQGPNRLQRGRVSLAIECDLEIKDAYTYTCENSRLAELEREAAAARALGFAAEVTKKPPLPFETAGALRFVGEAQFNPAKYLGRGILHARPANRIGSGA